MPTDLATPDHLPILPNDLKRGSGVVGAGFIVRDCHLVAYADAGFKVVGLTSRTRSTVKSVARLRGVPKVFDTVEAMLDDGQWHRPRWPQSWFPDALAGTRAGLLIAIETDTEPDISVRDHLQTLAFCEAVLDAASEHRVVTMDQE